MSDEDGNDNEYIDVRHWQDHKLARIQNKKCPKCQQRTRKWVSKRRRRKTIDKMFPEYTVHEGHNYFYLHG